MASGKSSAIWYLPPRPREHPSLAKTIQRFAVSPLCELERAEHRQHEASPPMTNDSAEVQRKLFLAQRTAKREERRAEQRRQNVGRAATMHASRLAAEESGSSNE